MNETLSIFWFRRDLRLNDNSGLYHALKNEKNVQPIFIFDPNILNELEDKTDARVTFIHQEVVKLNEELKKNGVSLWVFYARPDDVFEKIIPKIIDKKVELKNVYTNHDYEPYALDRDKRIQQILNKKSSQLLTFKDQCIFEKREVVKDDGLPYTVFTPYKNKWFKTLKAFHLKSYPTEKYSENFNKHFQVLNQIEIPSLQSMGFSKSNLEFPKIEFESILKDYAIHRDIPSIKGTSKISLHLRFGTVSIRELARKALGKSDSWLNELIWRDFYFQILWNFPHVSSSAFKSEYERIPWRNNEKEFDKWCNGETGYPIVDAGMRELNSTGFMHNRIRMVVASFLTKHLLIDWKWGEAYFAKKLLDFELSSNNGGWQWAAGSGCDAAPYFRIFNPYEQTKKFDPELKYIKKWVPEFQELNYPSPIVDHKLARERCLAAYKKGLAK